MHIHVVDLFPNFDLREFGLYNHWKIYLGGCNGNQPSRPRQSLDISDLYFDLSLHLNLGGQKFKNSHNSVIFEPRSLKFCIEVDLGNPEIDLTSILTSASVSEVKIVKEFHEGGNGVSSTSTPIFQKNSISFL